MACHCGWGISHEASPSRKRYRQLWVLERGRISFPRDEPCGTLANPKKSALVQKNAFRVSQSNIQDFHLWSVKKSFVLFLFLSWNIKYDHMPSECVLRWQCVVLTCCFVSCLRLLSRFHWRVLFWGLRHLDELPFCSGWEWPHSVPFPLLETL